MVTGTNAKVIKYNTDRLNEIDSPLEILKATVYSDARGVFELPDSKLKHGIINNTTLPYEVTLKLGCRVMLTTNMDICDGLVNGTLGTVVGFERQNEKVSFVMIEFDDIEDGKVRRQNFKGFNLEGKYPGVNATPIGKIEQSFSLSSHKGSASSNANALGFPIRLCYAATAHKMQGYTVKKPKGLILDLDCRLQPAMIYVMISRIQNLNQLFIMENFNEKIKKQFKPFNDALLEVEKLKLREKQTSPIQNDVIKVVSLNTLSLRKHIPDLKTNQGLNACDAICLQETWLNEGEESAETYNLQDKTASYVSVGNSRGIANYFSSKFVEGMKIAKPNYQLAAIESQDIMIINIYRSSGPFEADFNKDFTNIFESNHGQKLILAMGDLNFCEREEAHHPIRKMLLEKKFQSLLYQVPGSTTKRSTGTHIKGRCLDQAYQWSRDGKYDLCTASVWTSSFSDHDPIFVEIRFGDEQSNKDNCDAFSKAKQAWSEKTFLSVTAKTKKSSESPRIMKTTRPENISAKSANVSSSSILLKQVQSSTLDNLVMETRRFTNPADKRTRVNKCLVFSKVRCWMNASLQLLLCGLDHKGESGWQCLRSGFGLMLREYRRHIEYNNTDKAFKIMKNNTIMSGVNYKTGDPITLFDNIDNVGYEIGDVKSIFSHSVSKTRLMNHCSHKSKRPEISTRVSTLLSLPPDNSDMNHYMEQPFVDKSNDNTCEECKNKGVVSRGAHNHFKLLDHNQDFILFNFNVPEEMKSNIGTQRIVDHQRNVNLRDSTGRVAEYQVIAIILYVNQNHYVTHVRRTSGHWMECDDSNVKLLDNVGVGNHLNGHVHSILLKHVQS